MKSQTIQSVREKLEREYRNNKMVIMTTNKPTTHQKMCYDLIKSKLAGFNLYVELAQKEQPTYSEIKETHRKQGEILGYEKALKEFLDKTLIIIGRHFGSLAETLKQTAEYENSTLVYLTIEEVVKELKQSLGEKK